MPTDKPTAPIGDFLDKPPPPRPGLRRSGGRQVHALAPGVAALLAAQPAPVALAFELGQHLGAGTMGPLVGCPQCRARAGVRLGAALACLLCGASWGGGA
mgnify:CR=1 FL=1